MNPEAETKRKKNKEKKKTSSPVICDQGHDGWVGGLVGVMGVMGREQPGSPPVKSIKH